jgi:AcrR family transcriptional regulator
MPKYVDNEKRRDDIVRVATKVLAEDGYENFSLRKVGRLLGGSQSLVTHYFKNRETLFSALGAIMAEKWESELPLLIGNHNDSREKLRQLMLWLIPNTPEKIEGERWRMQLSAARHRDPIAAQILMDFDSYVRKQLTNIIRELVDAKKVEHTIDMIRAVSSGVELEAHEHGWSPDRQETVVNDALDRIVPKTV